MANAEKAIERTSLSANGQFQKPEDRNTSTLLASVLATFEHFQNLKDCHISWGDIKTRIKPLIVCRLSAIAGCSVYTRLQYVYRV